MNLAKRYRIALCGGCLSIGLELTLEEYDKVWSIIMSSTRDEAGSTQPETFGVQRSCREEEIRCSQCKGTGWVFTTRLGEHAFLNMTTGKRY